ncbi:MAG: 2-hydroxyacyl-CoA dehydratase [Candidatus Aminicenantes bacterium]|nr:MAG: 2-hydroxyacyl-CoA dehydratase [Candidatus Aminicenantes bacterium]
MKTKNSCHPPESSFSAGGQAKESSPVEPIAWFQDMVPHALEYATEEKAKGKKIVGIMCEYTPRELIMAANAIPVCLCGGSAEMIPPAEVYLPSNLCPLIKSTFGYSIQKANPFLEMADFLVAETTCDGKKKMYELLAERHPMVVLELPQKPDDPDAFQHWIKEIAKLKSELETRFTVTITQESLRDAIRKMNRERELRRKLAELMKDEAPPLTGRELLDMKSLISCIPEDLDLFEKALEVLPGRTLDPPAESRIRVLLTGVPLPHGAEKVMNIIESNGGLVVCQENCTGLKPLLEDIREDTLNPLEALAEKYFHIPCSVMTTNARRLDTLRSLIRDYKPQCVIELVWHSCITYDVESYFVRKMAEEETGLSYLKIDTDYSPSDSARLAMRVQALFETVRGKR